MIRAPRVWISRPCVANEPLAEETSRPRTSAATVAVTPLASLTTSLLSAFRWYSGRTDRRASPSSAPPVRQAATSSATAVELTAYLPCPRGRPGTGGGAGAGRGRGG